MSMSLVLAAIKFLFVGVSSLAEGCDVDDDMLMYRGDGYCDKVGGLNSPQCNYDDGDCCEDTCQGSLCGNNGYQCLATLNCSVEHFEYITDGFCDIYGGYNTAECLFDGGDCCETTCDRDIEVTYRCRNNAYDCVAVCESDNSSSGNGICDEELNTELCGWDGGDCCLASCVAGTPLDCGSLAYDCRDPDEAGECQASGSPDLGNGFCDNNDIFNTAVCNFDGGDCCEETCEDATHPCDTTREFEQAANPGQFFELGGFRCVDPMHSQCKVPRVGKLGDGFCDGGPYNTEECRWDFGDCCEETCVGVNSDEYPTCGEFPYDCLDPLHTPSHPIGPFSDGNVIRLGSLRPDYTDRFLAPQRFGEKEEFDQIMFQSLPSEDMMSWWIVDVPGLNAYPGTFTLRPFTDPDRYLHRWGDDGHYKLGLIETPGTDTPFAHSATWYWQDPLAEGDGTRVSMNILVTRSSDLVRIDGSEEVLWGAFELRSAGLIGYVLQAVRRPTDEDEEDLLDVTFKIEFADLGPLTLAPTSSVPTLTPAAVPTAPPSPEPTLTPTPVPAAPPNPAQTPALTSIPTEEPFPVSTQSPTPMPTGAPTPSPTTRNSSAVVPPPVSSERGEVASPEDAVGSGSPEDAADSASSLTFGEILSIALGVALVFAVAGIFAVRYFILYQRQKDSDTLSPGGNSKHEIRQAKRADEEEELQPGAEPQPNLIPQTTTRTPGPGSETPRRHIGVQMARRTSEDKLTRRSDESPSRTANATIDKRHSVMNVVLGEDAGGSSTEDTRSTRSEDAGSTRSEDATSSRSEDVGRTGIDDEKSGKSKSDEWFGNPEDIGGFVNETAVTSAPHEAIGVDQSVTLGSGRQTPRFDNDRPPPSSAAGINLVPSSAAGINLVPPSGVQQDALSAALGLAPGELFASEADLLQRVRTLLQPEGGASPRAS